MARNAQETQSRILEAATEEFARHGIAGARVDRITRAAGVNGALLYRYFGSKLNLFDAVYSDLVTDLVRDVPLNPADLVGYVDRLLDYYAEHPDVVRLAAWRQLERPDQELPDVVVAAQHDKIERIRDAQAHGVLPGTLSADELLNLLLTLSLSGTPLTPGAEATGQPVRRSAILAAVGLLVHAQ
ncbi:TetR family transcriptional regulator [Streptomyces sp. NBC_01341]|uniref:TetR/AcrR family transcriptional regulator n=1 Tax=Streptomyces sp. NBC_01341 TaxID=2903831 RepID=UPI002E11BC62|nr:TetR family transcriptional regulator [Streptomyces sp. NBC_01341]